MKKAIVMTAKEFYNKHIGKGIDIDHSCGIQCVDLFKAFTKENFNKTAFAAGASIGFTIPYRPQWRLEVGYDYISETNYNQIP